LLLFFLKLVEDVSQWNKQWAVFQLWGIYPPPPTPTHTLGDGVGIYPPTHWQRQKFWLAFTKNYGVPCQISQCLGWGSNPRACLASYWNRQEVLATDDDP
jgi:hypothetical protein